MNIYSFDINPETNEKFVSFEDVEQFVAKTRTGTRKYPIFEYKVGMEYKV